MERWGGIVLAISPPGGDGMASRLLTCLHPVAGRPLVWHTVANLAAVDPRPERVVVVSEVELPAELFQGLVDDLEIVVVPDGEPIPGEVASLGTDHAIVIDAAAPLFPETLQALQEAPEPRWVGASVDDPSAARVPADDLASLLDSALPLRSARPLFEPRNRLMVADSIGVVRDRAQLAEFARRIRDRLVLSLMRSGATFLLPETVTVDVDVRIGRDAVIYPGVVLEGSTTIGDETVVGPGCRIIDSWIGSGVELKGWNYISHASIRNRAILEPYVRRGFD
jgi:bifunctional N-acetylglucosamine-1-phosphate-uridyltransferase/glucosamine-1-phosphate-acetyltransferase GlmU-like protein